MQRNKHNTNNKVVENKREQITESSDSDVSTQEVPRRKKTPFPRQLRKRESSLTIRKDSMQGFVHLACILLVVFSLSFLLFHLFYTIFIVHNIFQLKICFWLII